MVCSTLHESSKALIVVHSVLELLHVGINMFEGRHAEGAEHHGGLFIRCAGVNIQKHVLDLMEFKPLMPHVKQMDPRCFSK